MCKFAGNQGKRQNFVPSILPYKFGLIFMRMKEKKIFFEQNGRFFKMAGFQNHQFSKFHRLVHGLVGLIDAKAIYVAQPIWL